jgi:hypothetical protein
VIYGIASAAAYANYLDSGAGGWRLITEGEIQSRAIIF